MYHLATLDFQLKFFAKENSVSVRELEEALLQWRLNSTKTAEVSFNQAVQPSVPNFIEQVSEKKFFLLILWLHM
jgi:hypothetical protein